VQHDFSALFPAFRPARVERSAFGMTENDKPPSLDELDAQLREARRRLGGGTGQKDRPEGPTTSMNGLGLAFRIGTELVAGIAVGAGIGYALDRWLGTGPWLMVAFFFMGSAAGILNVYRAMGNLARRPTDDRP